MMTSCTSSKNDVYKIVKSDKFVDIGTHKLRVVLSDIPSEYTIILEAGGGNYSDAYKEIQDTLVSHDRRQSQLGRTPHLRIGRASSDGVRLYRCLAV